MYRNINVILGFCNIFCLQVPLKNGFKGCVLVSSKYPVNIVNVSYRCVLINYTSQTASYTLGLHKCHCILKIFFTGAAASHNGKPLFQNGSCVYWNLVFAYSHKQNGALWAYMRNYIVYSVIAALASAAFKGMVAAVALW